VTIGLLLVLGLLVVATHGVNRTNPLMQTVGYSVIALLSALLVFKAAITPPGSDARASRPMELLAYLGKRSYALYIVHLPLKAVARHFWGQQLEQAGDRWPVGTDVVLVLVLSAVSVAIAQATWVALERPFLSLKDRLAPR